MLSNKLTRDAKHNERKRKKHDFLTLRAPAERKLKYHNILSDKKMRHWKKRENAKNELKHKYIITT